MVSVGRVLLFTLLPHPAILPSVFNPTKPKRRATILVKFPLGGECPPDPPLPQLNNVPSDFNAANEYWLTAILAFGPTLDGAPEPPLIWL